MNKDVFDLKQTDPEFSRFFNDFAFEEVTAASSLDPKTRWLAILAILHGCQGIDTYKAVLPEALKDVTPVEVKELSYQACAYLGIGRVFPFLKANNEVFEKLNIALPLEDQSTTDKDTRLIAGNDAQVEIFGEGMKGSYNNGTINYWLADNCFGDYYTRKGLDLKQREMITFCILSAQGGCEPQAIAHAKGNFNMGNDASFLKEVILQAVPYIGYPRTLNAIRCIDEAGK